MTRAELEYGRDQLHTYKIRFEYNSETISEFIHCFVLEWYDLDKYDRPGAIKVKQIHSLRSYLRENKGRTSERILSTAELEYVYAPF